MKLRGVWKKLVEGLQENIQKILLKKQNPTKELETKTIKRRPHFVAFKLLGNRVARFLPLFNDLEGGLHKSHMNMTLQPYVSLIIFSTLLTSSVVGFLVTIVCTFLLHINVFPSLLFGIGIGSFAGVITILSLYAYPYYKADSLRRNLDSNLAFTASYLAILAGSGVPPDSMFRSLSKIPNKLAVVDESKTITRDIELFGVDTITALELASKRTSSVKFKRLLEGFISTIRSGGNLKSYLMTRSRQNLRMKRLTLKKFSDTLGILSEFYVTLLIAGPLIFVVMLSVMAMLGGGLGFMDPALMLMILTYIVIPMGSLVFIIILDALTPR
jgi:flagellar protein FlaJ